MQNIKVVGQTVQAWERKQTDGRTDGRYQVHYLPRFAVDNEKQLNCFTIEIHEIDILMTFIILQKI